MQPLIALFQPEQLEPHQLRPEDMHELGDMSKTDPSNGYEYREKGYEINEGYTPDYQAQSAPAPVDYDDPKLFSQPTRL